MRKYHDEEWGTPNRDDWRLFKELVLDGAQAGLSRMTILRKRENYRQAYDQFDVAKVAAYDQAKIEELLANPGLIRNGQKVNSAIKNARAETVSRIPNALFYWLARSPGLQSAY